MKAASWPAVLLAIAGTAAQYALPYGSQRHHALNALKSAHPFTLVIPERSPTDVHKSVTRQEPRTDDIDYVLPVGTYALISPNYPLKYPNNFDGGLSLIGEGGAMLTFYCKSFDVQGSRRCQKDWLEVNGRRYCGRRRPRTLSAEMLDITFHSDGRKRRWGFLCTIDVAPSPTTVSPTTQPPTAEPPTAQPPTAEPPTAQPPTAEPPTTQPPTTQPPTAQPPTTESPTTESPGGCCCGVPNRATRIVGGEETELNEYPWQAGLLNVGSNSIFCGGTVIKSRYILTAAHCTAGEQAGSLQVVLGNHVRNPPDGDRFTVSRIIDHPHYSSETLDNDFSLLKLSERIVFLADNLIAPACLPTDLSATFEGAEAVVSGWGTTSWEGYPPSSLMEVTVPVISNEACSQSYYDITSNMICAGVESGGKDSCQGDSGGPLVTQVVDRYTLIGVVSSGYRCAEPGYPGIYARVTAVMGWINQEIGSDRDCN